MSDRERLVNECLVLAGEIGWKGFRAEFFTDPEAVAQWPDPAVREKQLRAAWELRRGECEQSVRARFAEADIAQMTAYRDELRTQAGREVAYYETVKRSGRALRRQEKAKEQER